MNSQQCIQTKKKKKKVKANNVFAECLLPYLWKDQQHLFGSGVLSNQLVWQDLYSTELMVYGNNFTKATLCIIVYFTGSNTKVV